MKKTYLVLGLGLLTLFTACKSEESQTGSSDVILEAADEDPETIKANKEAIAEMEREEAELKASTTTMKFDKMEHNFGSVKVGSENNCTFIVTNTGTKPLVISDVKASCGCTTPSKPEKPILPGKSDKIEVGFKPNGAGPSEKTVTVTANTEPRIEVLKIKADVK